MPNFLLLHIPFRCFSKTPWEQCHLKKKKKGGEAGRGRRGGGKEKSDSNLSLPVLRNNF